jgi:hypothetical protein
VKGPAAVALCDASMACTLLDPACQRRLFAAASCGCLLLLMLLLMLMRLLPVSTVILPIGCMAVLGSIGTGVATGFWMVLQCVISSGNRDRDAVCCIVDCILPLVGDLRSRTCRTCITKHLALSLLDKNALGVTVLAGAWVTQLCFTPCMCDGCRLRGL